ncbi:MAG: hypothetical protein GC199_03980 [Alphaproteobacteria bacterium]|nr:hypothetical protein [Alphaproteobacteria bacterium]
MRQRQFGASAMLVLLLSACASEEVAVDDGLPPPGSVLTFTCSQGRSFVASMSQDGETALVKLDGREFTLSRERTTTGIQYTDGNAIFWSKGSLGMLKAGGGLILTDCQTSLPVLPAAPVPEVSAPEAIPELAPAPAEGTPPPSPEGQASPTP